jgi:hypothetical protein
MSLTDTLTLDNSSGTEATFSLQGRDNQGSRRIDTASTLTEPRSLIIKHSKTGNGVNAIDRHLIQFSRTELDSATVPRTAIVNLTMAVPQSAVFSSSEIKDMVAYLVDLVSDGGFSGSGFAGTTALDQLLRSES